MISLSEKTILFVARGANSGKSPFAPGTAGTLAAIPLAFVFSFLPYRLIPVFITLFFIISVYFADRAATILNDSDPGEVVIDEIAGYLVAVAGLGHSIWLFAAAFFLFRLFDIVKPWPAGAAEKFFKGGSGIVFDDILAGVYVNIILQFFF